MTDTLLQELLARQIGSGYTRIAPQVHPTIAADTWRGIDQALALLPESTRDTMPNITVQDDPGRRYVGEPIINARVDQTDPTRTIRVVGNTPTFTKATRGNVKAIQQLAAMLVHEQYHAEHGADESSAYDAQVSTLRKLGASKSAIADVLAARDFALPKKK